MITCPSCGGSDVALIAPGYFECHSMVLAGESYTHPEQPIYVPCGHGFQQAVGLPTDALPRCSCSVFAIGVCATCSTPLCGRHGQHVGDRMLCARCAAAEVEAAAAAQRQRNEGIARDAEAFKKGLQEEKDRLTAGFPTRYASGAQIAAALESLVPSLKEDYHLERGMLGFRARTIRGWGFVLTSSTGEGQLGNSIHKWFGVLVAQQGDMYSVTGSTRIHRLTLPTRLSGKGRLQQVKPESSLSGEHLETMRSRVAGSVRSGSK